MVRRFLVAIVLIVVLALAGWILSLTFDDADAPPPTTWPVAVAPKPSPAPSQFSPTRVAGKVPPAPPPRPHVEPPVPPQPIARGRLECSVRAWQASVKTGRRPDLTACELTVLRPSGEVVTSAHADSNGSAVFAPLPHGVPLVLRVAAPDFLTGLCCDVVLPADSALRKTIDLIPAPAFGVRVLQMPRRSEVRNYRVELRRGDEVVARGEPAKRGEAWMTVPAIGRFRARVLASDGTLLADVPVTVWPFEEPVAQEIHVCDPGTIEVVVAQPDGRGAAGVKVWLLGEPWTRPPTITDSRGRATFAGVAPSAELTVVSRASDGTVAAAQVTTSSRDTQRVPLWLGKPSALVGEVVDEGGSPIRDAEIEVVVRPIADPVVRLSDATGAFSVPLLPPGVADVVVRRKGWLDWRPERPVVVEARGEAKLQVRMHRAPMGAVVVTVRDETGGPLGGATVTLFPSRLSARTAADGTCRVDGLPAGVEQTAFAKRKGFRTRLEAAANPPVVRVVQDVAVDAEIVLRAAGADAVRGDASAVGTVLDPESGPVVGARVECGAAAAYAGLDGRFRIDGLVATTSGEPAELRIAPPPGMLQPFGMLVDLDDGGVLDFGTVRLRARPCARITLPSPPATGRGNPASATFWLSCNHGDTLLGATSGRFDPVACVSYDGTWLHVPPADDWRIDGRGEVFVAFPTQHGLCTATSAWTLTPDAVAALRPEFNARPARVVLSVPNRRNRGTLTLIQEECATLFDPKSVHVPTGNEQDPVDPFASLAAARWFTVTDGGASVVVEDLAPGAWHAVLGDGDGAASADFTVPGEDTVVVDR